MTFTEEASDSNEAMVDAGPDFSCFIGDSPAMRQIFNVMSKLLDIDSTVLILGESGSGKELIARAIHQNSPRSERRMITVNCGAIPEELLESELFGHEKGSFTGAIRSRVGKFELAHQGTIFLDEIGDMSPTLQVKLLRVLQEREIERVGASQTFKVDVRVIAATNQNLEKAVAERRFREDLFYRLNVVPIEAPPLRARDGDISLLIGHFIKIFNRSMGRKIRGISPEALAKLKTYEWPGNVRELEHMIERLVALKGEGIIEQADLPLKLREMEPEEEQMLVSDMLLVGEPDDLSTEGVAGQVMPDANESIAPTTTKPVSHFAEPYRREPAANILNGNKSAHETRAMVDPTDFTPFLPDAGVNLKKAVDQFETQLIVAALERSNWVKNKAANLLGLNRTTLVEKLKKKDMMKRREDQSLIA